MKHPVFRLVSLVILFSMLLGACSTASVTPTAAPVTGAQPTEITGDFTYTNGFAVETYYVEQASALVDMHGFVVRDQLWEMPIDGQTLGFMSIDYAKKTGSYHILLPEQPLGTFDDVSNSGKKEQGVQIYSASYWPNLTGGPYSEGDDSSFGWPGYLTSVKVDTENQQEVIGGKLVIWAPDASQSFPTGFGPDKKLFTKDDPEGPVPAGWSVIDLDTDPFTIIRESTPKLTLYEPADLSLKDFSADSYTAAFNKMFDIVKKEYAFNGIDNKAPNWDALYASIYPRIQDAETKKDATAYYLALRDFTFAFKDGHTGLSDGAIESNVFSTAVAGGYGFTIRELDDGSVIVVYVTTGGPAAQAGIQVGDTITQFNDKAIGDAIGAVQDLASPHSMESSHRYQQARYLLRAAPGTEAKVTFKDTAGAEKTVTLKAIAERDSFSYTSVYKNYDANALPVEFKIIDTPSGTVGYVKINSNYDDLNLIIRLFERALKTFTQNSVNGLVIDMRVNSGGANLGLAGFLYNKEIPMGQLEYYSSTTGKFEPEGPRERVLPNVNQYTFPKMALLVGQGCASACELEAYGFSQVPGMMVVGMYPTSGTEAEVARGQFNLPESMSLQVPTGRFINTDGSLFLEGVGVQPTVKVPINAANVLSKDDVELIAAENAVLKPNGAGVTPSGAPELVANPESALLSGSVKFLEEYAHETYNGSPKPGEHFTYTIALDSSKQTAMAWGWCAKNSATLTANYKSIQLKFTIDGKDLTADKIASYPYASQGMACQLDYVVLDKWPAGEHHLGIAATFTAAVDDGTGAAPTPAGTAYYDYTVYVGK